MAYSIVRRGISAPRLGRCAASPRPPGWPPPLLLRAPKLVARCPRQFWAPCFVSVAPGHEDENSASYLPDLPVLVKSTQYNIYVFHVIIFTMKCVPSTGNKRLLTYLLTYLLNCVDPYSEYGCGPTKLLNTDPDLQYNTGYR